ncbi:MAG: hypothetical protein GVY28_14360 [Alphaproteobacteria bacterium]|jgi:hypothetical protein|nr:hypothetical protein [Alphaproteobacteria bacterium]
MPTEKESINAAHHWRLDDAVAYWRANKVIPYSRAYADAYAVFKQTRDDAEKDAQARAELYIAVGLIVGTAVCSLGPIAGVLAAGQRATRVGLVSLANAANRLGVANRAAAWSVMTRFTFGGAPQLAAAGWGSHGKDILKKHMSDFALGGVPNSTERAPSATQPIRPRNSSDNSQLPIEYYLTLDGLLLKSRNALAATASEMVDNKHVPASELEEFWQGARRGNLIVKAPKKAMADADLRKLANEMELAIWATAALSWKWKEKHRNVNRSGMNPGHYYTTEYSNYLDEDRVLERIDKVAKAAGVEKYTIMQYKQSRDSKGQPVMRSYSSRALPNNWDDTFGMWHSDDDKNLFIQWARTYVTEKAKATVMPLDLQ